MFKKFLLLFFSIIALTGSLVFAGPTMGGDRIQGTVLLSELPIAFKNEPFILDGEVMVPAKDFFEKIGAQVLLIEDSNEVVSYRDNIFIKFKPNTATAYVNGNPKTMPVSAFMHAGELFIPASFASLSNEMNFTNNATTKSISIDYRENVLEYQQFGLRHFKRESIANWGISFFIPEYWTKDENSIATYGVENSFESYKLDLKLITLDQPLNRSTLTDNEVAELESTLGEAMEISSRSTMKLGDYTSDVVYYDVKENGLTSHHVLYVFYEQSRAYVFYASYPSTNDFLESKDIFDTIASTFSITKLSVNENLEHYTELSLFYEHGITIETEIYSNMAINDKFRITGNLKNPHNLKGFRAFVSKDGQVIDYYIPVNNGEFDANIYTPFGLGKHNITLVADDGTDHNKSAFTGLNPLLNGLDDYVTQLILMNAHYDPTKSILKFSVLNTSDEPIKESLPTDYVNYDHQEIYNITNALTFTLTNQYSKSRLLYQWVVENYTYTEQIRADGLMNAFELISVKEANAAELCFIYTALLRASDIPARIVRGITEEGMEYWVETYINGQWFVSSIASDVLNATGTLEYFNMNRALHYENFITVEILQF